MLDKRYFGERVFDSFNVIIMIFIFIIMLYPFVYIISYSLSDPFKMKGGFIITPAGLNLSNYVACFKIRDILNGLFISVSRTIIGTVLMIFFNSMAAYSISRNDMLFVKFFRRYFVFTMYFSGGLIPVYLVMKSLHLTNSFWVYIIPSIVAVFNMVLIRIYIESLPIELQDAAIVDGANDFVLFHKVIFPLCRPVIAAVALFTAIGHWNAYLDTAIYNSMRRDLYSLQYVLYNFLSTTQRLQLEDFQFMQDTRVRLESKGLNMAITVITIFPIACVYPFAKKHFASGLLIGSIKG